MRLKLTQRQLMEGREYTLDRMPGRVNGRFRSPFP